MLNRVLAFCLLILSPYSVHAQNATPTPPRGVFHGRLVLVPVGDGVHMKLQEAFSYTDWEGHVLEAPVGFESDGATIPRAAWSIIGGPWNGKYIAAAVVHDVGCDTHKYSWQITGRLFYEAMVDSDVPKAQALTMYYAVLVGGPHWNLIAAPTGPSRDDVRAKLNDIQEAAQSAADKKSSDAIKTQASGELMTTRKTALIVTSEDAGYKIRATKGGPGGGARIYQGYVFSQLPTKDLSDNDLKKFLADVQQREASGKPLTPEDVEKKAMVDGFSQMTF